MGRCKAPHISGLKNKIEICFSKSVMVDQMGIRVRAISVFLISLDKNDFYLNFV